MFLFRSFSPLFLDAKHQLIAARFVLQFLHKDTLTNMHAPIGLHETHALVPPLDFVRRMTDHWTSTLGLCVSDSLCALWRVMADNFNAATRDAIDNTCAPWRILQPPTGSGKTQGACVYAAMQAQLNHEVKAPLIVTRRIQDADRLVSTINELAGADVAIAHHSERRATSDQLDTADVLVITHQAYLRLSGAQETIPWSRVSSWKHGPRLLTIIDEALTNAVESSKVTVEALGQVLGYIPTDLHLKFPKQVAALKQLQHLLLGYARADDNAARMAWKTAEAPIDIELDPLRVEMRTLPFDQIALRNDSPTQRMHIARRVDAVLQAAQSIMDSWAYFAQKGAEPSINSALLAVPLDAPGPVVLDATARANFFWDLFGERAIIIPVPARVRDYSAVTLHVARAQGLGKHTMIKKVAERWPRVAKALATRLDQSRRLFVCMHRDTEHHPLKFESPCGGLSVGHWGAIDGRNEWADHDAALIFGLPYRDQVWSTNTFFAIRGEQDDEWLQSPSWKNYQDVRRVMEQRHMSVSIIQAINRIRCRRVIDAEGGCLPADVFLILPNGKEGDAILGDITTDMPNLNVVDWPFELDGPKVRGLRSGSADEALVAFMRNKLPGETPFSKIQRELSLKAEGVKSLRERLRNPKSTLFQKLAEQGVKYVSLGAGRGAKSYLVKHAPI
ncbi:hypothetical protein X566_04570 [Afipia sp. P52-10]|uniref:hypothetical protein n=1 Tax=Afipia sp. P52-10 TaxID=1429916 RepID=UPI0003DF0D40|nr:hypothetical protein [Afipia sp. P52-10]ETR76982.1 hypothetical protein X566_04570 [Afipia sp. P52-10]